MRVIAGEFKGRKLKTFKGEKLRPLTDRIKTSVFDYLDEYINESDVLDLFSGTGSFGIEAISRGAKFVIFVENYKPAINLIINNLERLSCNPEKYEIICSDAIDYLNILKKRLLKFDLIFTDPPYKYPFFDELIDAVISAKSLSKKGIFIIRHPEDVKISESGKLKLIRDKKFADAYVKFFVNEED